MVFPPILASLLLASPDVAVVFCAAIGPSVTVVLSAVDIPGDFGVSALAILLLASLLLLVFPPVLTSLLLLASSALPVVF
jgi:hypothetical protein